MAVCDLGSDRVENMRRIESEVIGDLGWGVDTEIHKPKGKGFGDREFSSLLCKRVRSDHRYGDGCVFNRDQLKSGTGSAESSLQ